MTGYLVVNADDLGVSRGATLGILRAHQEGIVTSASLAVTTPWYEQAVTSCVQTCPDLGVGLHFTLTSGKPQSRSADVPMLVDAKGYFRWRFLSLMRAMRGPLVADLCTQIHRELEAQIHRLHADGIRPDHIDGERHIHLIPGIFELVVAAARRHDIKYVRAGADLGLRLVRASHLPALVAGGGFAKSWLLSRLSHRGRGQLAVGVRSVDWVASYLYSGRTDLMTPELASVNGDGRVIELMVHPGIPEESRNTDLGNRGVESYLVSNGRRRELDACVAARGRMNGMRLTNYTQLASAEPLR